MPKPKTKQKLTPLYNKAAKLMQEAHRANPRPCACCGRQAEVLHHHQHWGNSVALRFEPMNLIPMTAGCHNAWHKRADLGQKRRMEKYMKDLYGDNWEDLLLEIEQNAPHMTHCEKVDMLHELIATYRAAV